MEVDFVKAILHSNLTFAKRLNAPSPKRAVKVDPWSVGKARTGGIHCASGATQKSVGNGRRVSKSWQD